MQERTLASNDIIDMNDMRLEDYSEGKEYANDWLRTCPGRLSMNAIKHNLWRINRLEANKEYVVKATLAYMDDYKGNILRQMGPYVKRVN